MRKILISILLASVAVPASATALYRNDFDNPQFVQSGVSFSATDPTGQFNQTTVGAWNAAGWAGRSYRNDTTGNPASITQYSFSGLAAHNVISMSFIVGLLDSWDSRDGNPSPDNFDIYIDGSLVASLTAANASGNIWDAGGGTDLARCVQADTRQFFCDTLVDWSKTFAHTSSTLTLGWRASGAGWQGGSDESWGLDNIKIDYFTRGGVPEPAAWAMMLAGFGLVGGAVRRRKMTTHMA